MTKTNNGGFIAGRLSANLRIGSFLIALALLVGAVYARDYSSAQISQKENL